MKAFWGIIAVLIVLGVAWAILNADIAVPRELPNNNDSVMEDESDDGESVASLTPAAAHFTAETRTTVVAELGQPIEGFEPFMFMEVYPGLVASDFDGVEAALGEYSVSAQGDIVFELDRSQPEHSAARAITEQGMGTLLENVATRLNMPLTTEAEVNAILTVLAQ